MTPPISEEQKQKVYTRLTRSARWTELDRREGYVILLGERWRRVIREELPEDVLNALLVEGRVQCDASQRLMDGNPNRLNAPSQEVTVKYWSVVP